MIIEVKAIVKPTENEEKIKKCIDNVFSYEVLKKIKEGENVYLLGTASNINSLSKLANLIKQERKELSVRSILNKSIHNNTLFFHLNKQAVYMNKLSFCTVENEAPLGTIEFKIFANDLNKVIDFLAPLPKPRKPKRR